MFGSSCALGSLGQGTLSGQGLVAFGPTCHPIVKPLDSDIRATDLDKIWVYLIKIIFMFVISGSGSSCLFEKNKLN